jgi:hypothetical protein
VLVGRLRRSAVILAMVGVAFVGAYVLVQVFGPM